ncbi:MAG TPA: tyrosine-type recombinase/integrase [Ktedonobacteraceae bacterium]
MTHPQLALVHNVEVVPTLIPFSQRLADHHAILQGYLDTHVTRNHSDRTIESERRFLLGWFESFMMPDENHPDEERQLFIWEAMVPVLGRQRIVGFSKGLIDAGLKPRTVQGYLGSLRRLFQYVLDYPYIPATQVQPIVSRYGRLEQPVLEYDYPVHVLDQEEEGFVLTGEQLLQFYDFVRLEYLGHNQKKLPASRDYTMIVVAGESGLRADEIRHLDALGSHRDLFYEHNCIQTRHGKGSKGSGKRIRKTIFTPFAQDTMRAYEERIRPHFPNAKTNPALFLTESGERISYKAMWHNLHVITEEARKAGLEMPPKLSWHSLRKSFATTFMELHPDRPWVLMELLGHLNPSTLHRYVKHSRAYYDRAIEDIVGAMVIDAAQLRGVV